MTLQSNFEGMNKVFMHEVLSFFMGKASLAKKLVSNYGSLTKEPSMTKPLRLSMRTQTSRY